MKKILHKKTPQFMGRSRTAISILAVTSLLASLAAPFQALAVDVLIFSNEIFEENSNTLILDYDDTGGDVTVQFGSTLGEQLFWDNTNTQFTFTDDLALEGNNITLDSDNTGAGADVNIIAEQGADNNGVIRYNATTNQWELSNDGAAFEAIASGSVSDADTLDTLDSTQFLRSDTSDSFTSGTLDFNAGTTVDVNGTLDASGATDIIIPNTESNTFILDNDNTGGNVALQFGQTLNENLTWNNASSRFDLSDDLRVDGVIEQNGNSFTLDADNAVAGADVDIVANQGSDNDGTIRYNATTNQWELSNDGGAFNDIITDAEIGDRTFTNDNFVTDGETVTASIDALDTALGTATANATETIFVNMNDMTVVADGSNNNANIYSGYDETNDHQYYTVKSTQVALNDLDVKIKVRLPEDFVDFSNSGDLSFFYQNTGTNSTDSAIDILIEDNDGDDAFTAVDGQGLFNAAWTEYTDEFDGAGFDPAAGEYIFITLKGYASRDGATNQQPYMGEIVLTYTGSNR